MSEQNYYRSVDDIILYNWRMCLKGELNHVRIDLGKGNAKDDAKHWEIVYDSYLEEFGIGSDHEYYNDLVIELIQKRCEFIISGERFILNRIEVLEVLIDELMNKGGGSDMDTVIIYVSKWMGQFINERNITARMFFKMVKEYSIANKPTQKTKA